MPLTREDSSIFLKSLLDQYVAVGSYSFQSNELSTQLITQSGYVSSNLF